MIGDALNETAGLAALVCALRLKTTRGAVRPRLGIGLPRSIDGHE